MTFCVICFDRPTDPFSPKCGHIFCNKCIMTWITQHDECPMCRGDITQTKTLCDEDDDSDSEVEPHYNIEINGNVREDEFDDIIYRVDDFIDGTKDPYFKWKDSTNGSSYNVIKKNKYFIDLKFDMYKMCVENSYKIIVTLNRRNILNYDKRHPQYVKLNKNLNRKIPRHLFR